MSTEASSSSNVAAAVNEPQPTVIADETRPIAVVAVADEPQQKSTSRRPRSKIYYFALISTPPVVKYKLKKQLFKSIDQHLIY
jgi:hypothetical protein